MDAVAIEESVTMVRAVDVPNPCAQLARFRLVRLSESVQMISLRGRTFRDAVDAAVAGDEQRGATRVLARTFARTYHALRAALDAARPGGVVGEEALGALDGIMTVLKRESAGAVAGLRADVTRLDTTLGDRRDFAQFCAEASSRIDRLESFWQTTYEHVPRMKMGL